MASLAVATGIGRFAFTPLLPMMLADGVTDLTSASWLASANYMGYLVGALLCTLQPWLWRKLGHATAVNAPALVRIGLTATVVLTLGMALHLPAVWPALRFLAGVASAVVFVYTSGWCLAQLARMQTSAMGAVIYTGPGAGIVLSGLAASGMVAVQWSAATGWLIFGVLAAALTTVIWPIFSPRHDPPPVAPASMPAPGHTEPGRRNIHGGTEIALLAIGYGLEGFGYIITATFLPVIARQAIAGSPWLDLFWPIFGLGVIAGALVASRIRSTGDQRLRLAACYVVQALAIGTNLVYPSAAGFAAGSFLLGLPFTAITFFAMQEVRRLRPLQASSLMGLLTAVFGLGQIVGPPLVAALLARSRSVGAGFSVSLEIAAATLAAGAVLYVVMARMFPMTQHP